METGSWFAETDVRSSGVWEFLVHAPRLHRFKPGERRQEELWVLELLEKQYGDIHVGTRNISLSDQDVQHLFGQLQTGNPPRFRYRFRHNFLVKILQKGVQRLGWQLKVPSRLQPALRDKARFTPENFQLLARLRRVERAFLEDLQAFPHEDPSTRLGQILLSAILYGGMLKSGWLSALLASLDGGLRRNGNLLWCEMQRSHTLKRGGQPKPDNTEDTGGAIIRRRWFADPLTAVLITRWYSDFLIFSQPQDTIWENAFTGFVLPYLRRLDLPEDVVFSSLSELSNAVQVRLALLIPPYLVSYAACKTPAVSIPEYAWQGHLTSKAIRVDYEPGEPDEPIPVTVRRQSMPTPPPGSVVKDQQDLFRELMGIIGKDVTRYGQKRLTRGEVCTEVQTFLGNQQQNMVPIMVYLAQWSLDLMGGKRTRTPMSQLARSHLKPQSVSEYLQVIGKELIYVVADKDLCTLFPEEIVEVYNEVQSLKNTDKNKNRAAYILSYFHVFLMGFCGAPSVDLSELKGSIGPAELAVNANLVSMETYDLMLFVLGSDYPNPTRAQKMCIIAAILAFRCGMRREEVRKLRLADVHGRAYPEILVRENRYRTVKSRDAVRRLPLVSLLSESELRLFTQWRNDRLAEAGRVDTPDSSSLLLCEVGSPTIPIAVEHLITPVVRALRQVTGDQTLQYHHLRHSFANWLLVRLSMDAHKDNHFLNHPLFEPANTASLRQELLRNRLMGKQNLFLVSHLCGHSSPQITMKHYIHLCDWMLGWWLSQPDAVPSLSEKALMHITGIPRPTLYRLIRKNENVIGINRAVAKRVMDDARLHFDSPLDGRLVDANVAPVSIRRDSRRDLTHNWQLVHHVLREHQEFGHRPAVVADRFGLDEHLVSEWCAVADWIGGMTTKKGRYRHRPRAGGTGVSFPPAPRDKCGQELASKVLATVARAPDDKMELVRKWVSYFLDHYNPSVSGLRFIDPVSVREYLYFLKVIGVDASQCVALHYPAFNGAAATDDEQLRWWAEKLGLKERQCFPRGKGNFSATTGKGAVGIVVVGLPPWKDGSIRQFKTMYGFRFGMMMLAIVLNINPRSEVQSTVGRQTGE